MKNSLYQQEENSLFARINYLSSTLFNCIKEKDTNIKNHIFKVFKASKSNSLIWSLQTSKTNNSEKSESPYYINIPRHIDLNEEIFKSLEQEKLLPVPIDRKDDENFKLVTIKKHLKLKTHPQSNSEKKVKDFSSKYHKGHSNLREFSLMKRRKISHSVKKVFYSHKIFKTSKKEDIYFPVFSDKDIGIYRYWQMFLADTTEDDDVSTDNEQLSHAKHYIESELNEAFETISKEGIKAISNQFYIKSKSN